MNMTTKQRKTAIWTFGIGLMAVPAVHAQQQGARPPSGSGTTTPAQAAAKVAAIGTPTTTAMVGAPPPPAPVAKANVAGAAGSKTAPVNPNVKPGMHP